MTEPVRPPAATKDQARFYTARTRTIGGRERGVSRSYDGRLDVKLSVPGEPVVGTNPEQLFAAGWSASFASAVRAAARKRRIALAGDVAIDAEVDSGDGGYFLRARLLVNIPGVDAETAEALLAEAETQCPYCKATRGAIRVAINLEAP